MADFSHVTPLFGGSDYPRLDINYGHYQADSGLQQAGLPPYLKKFQIPDTYITGIKKQLLGNCWVYSSTAMYETFALSRGYASKNTDDDAILSETYMTYAGFDTKPGDASCKNPSGKQTVSDPKTGQKNYGGTPSVDALAFFMRGDAHTPEVCDPIDPATTPQAGLAPRLYDITANKAKSGYVTGFKLLEQPKKPFPDQDFIDDVKVNLLTYGPVAGGFFFAAERANAAGSSYACCCEENHPAFASAAGAHSVCIVGWDDDYASGNFNPNFRPKHNGAFLAKNSWGSGGGYDGYMWISYEDETMSGMCCITEMDPDFFRKPLKVLTHAPFGFMHPYAPADPLRTEFRCAYETCGESDLLYAVGLVSVAPCLADITVTAAQKTTTLFSNLLIERAGYTVKTLSTPLYLGAENTPFTISVVYRSINSIPVAVPLEYNDGTYYTNVSRKRGVCYIDGEDVDAIAARTKKNYGNIAMTVILQADSSTAQNTQGAYEDVTVPAASGGRIDGLPTSYGLAPICWRLEPYLAGGYHKTYRPQAKQYAITDQSGDIRAQGIVGIGSSPVSKLYLTAVIGEPDEILMRKAFPASLDAAGSYAFTVSGVTDDNVVDVSGTAPFSFACVKVSCNGQEQTTVADTTGSWKISQFRLYNMADGWKDEYASSKLTVELFDNQTAPVRLCSGTETVVLSSPIKPEKKPGGGWIVALVGGSLCILAGLAFACVHGCPGAPVTITLCGHTFRIGKGFRKRQQYTRLVNEGPDPATLELEDGPFDVIGDVENADIHIGHQKVDLAADTASTVYGGLTRELAPNASVTNCTISGVIESAGKSQVGALFGSGENVTVTNCRSTVEVRNAATCGGIAASVSGSSRISGCEISGSLSASGNAAGIVADMQGGVISDCCVTASIAGSQAAGIAAAMSDSAAVQNCFVASEIRAKEACGIAPGIKDRAAAVAHCVCACGHIGGERIARVSLFPGEGNVAYSGIHCDSGRTFADDSARLAEWYEFASPELFRGLGWDLNDRWEFVDTLMFVRPKGSNAAYSYPFFLVAQTKNGKFQLRVGSEITLTGSKPAGMPQVRWTGIMPQMSAGTAAENFWASDNTYVLTVPFMPTQTGSYRLGLQGSLGEDVYALELPLEVTE